MLRAFFVRLSENRSLRNFAERSALGRRVSGRFVAGTQIENAVRVTQAVNRAGMSVTIDNLGENVTNPDEARESAVLYQQILDAIAANGLNANISLKLTHMGLDVDENLSREIVSGLVARAASLNPPGFVRVDMEGSPYTQRTLDFVHELHRMPGHANSVGTVIQAYLKRSESRRRSAAVRRYPHSPVQRRLQRAGEYCIREQGGRGRELHQADEDADEKRYLSWHREPRRKHHPRSAGVCEEGEHRAGFL